MRLAGLVLDVLLVACAVVLLALAVLLGLRGDWLTVLAAVAAAAASLWLGAGRRVWRRLL